MTIEKIQAVCNIAFIASGSAKVSSKFLVSIGKALLKNNSEVAFLKEVKEASQKNLPEEEPGIVKGFVDLDGIFESKNNSERNQKRRKHSVCGSPLPDMVKDNTKEVLEKILKREVKPEFLTPSPTPARKPELALNKTIIPGSVWKKY